MKQAINGDMIGIGYAVHIINIIIQTAADRLPIYITVVVKLYSHFYIYTVRVEGFKEFSEEAFSEKEFSEVLSTRNCSVAEKLGG